MGLEILLHLPFGVVRLAGEGRTYLIVTPSA